MNADNPSQSDIATLEKLRDDLIAALDMVVNMPVGALGFRLRMDSRAACLSVTFRSAINGINSALNHLAGHQDPDQPDPRDV